MEKVAKTILLVEDEIIIALAEIQQLGKVGYKVVHSLTGEKAIETVKANPKAIDLILMDINLGAGMDGTQAAREILKHWDIPLLFLSSHMERDIVEKTEQITNYGYVVKSSVFTVLDASIKMAFKLFEANARLRVSEEKFFTAFASSPDSISITRLSDGCILEVNWGFTENTGYTREEVMGKSTIGPEINLWVHKEDRDNLVGKILTEGYLANQETEFRSKSGGTRLGLISARILCINGEDCIIATTRDMTEYRESQAALVRSENLMRALVDVVPVPIFFKDLEGHYTGCNTSFSELTGYSFERIRGKTAAELWPSEGTEESQRRDQQLIQNRERQVYSLAVIDCNGKRRPGIFSKDVFRDASGQLIGIVGAFMDTSDPESD